MANKNEQFKQRAKEFFADKKNANVSTVYFTSDNNMFRAEHYAGNWAAELKDKAVVAVPRADSKSVVREIIDQFIQAKFGSESESAVNTTDGAQGERDALIARYIELFDTKPKSAHNISMEKLREAIAAKELQERQEAESDDPAQQNGDQV